MNFNNNDLQKSDLTYYTNNGMVVSEDKDRSALSNFQKLDKTGITKDESHLMIVK
jgi:hypothetical protein